MDLGFGAANQAVGNAAASAIVQRTQAQEAAIDQQIEKYNALLEDAANDDDALEALRQRRLAQMRQAQDQRAAWRAAGHGSYVELGEGQAGADVAREFFKVSKASERLVVHFHRPTTQLCAVMHGHLQRLAAQHWETRFVKVNVDGCSDARGGSGASFLVEKLNIHILPTLVLIKERKAVHHLQGFDELGGKGDFETQTLAYVLGAYGVLHRTEEEEEEVPEELMAKRDVNAMRLSVKGGRQGRKGGGGGGGGFGSRYHDVVEDDD